MPNYNFYKAIIALFFAASFFVTGCAKYDGDYSTTNTKPPFAGTTYDFLKSKPGVFDSMLFVIDRLGLADTLKNKNTTLFAVTNQSFILALNNYNAPRIQQGKPAISLKDYDLPLLDSMMCRYIIMNVYKSDSMAYENGTTFSSVRYGYPMNGKKVVNDASGYNNGGTSTITFSDTKRNLFNGVWVKAFTGSIDIATANGMVNIMDPGHVFGFDEFTKPRPTPFKGIPFQFPTAIGGTGIILEAEDFDLGGESAGYHDNDPSNNGGNYRTKEGVDIYAHTATTVNSVSYTAGYDIGAVNPGEWLFYTINVPVAGNYTINMRYGCPNGVPGAYHIDIDNVNITGKLIAPPTTTGGSYNIWATIPTNVQLTMGKHTMRFYYEAAPLQLESFLIIRNN